jgi:hypothetical protein
MHRLIDRVDDAGVRRAMSHGDVGWAAEADLEQVVGVLRIEHGEHVDDDARRTEALLHDVFGLDDTDTAILWAAAACDLDASVATAYGHLRGAGAPSRATVALALELAGVPTATPEPFERLAAGSPLRRHRLVTVGDTGPWLARELSVPDAVLARLAGGTAADASVERLRVPVVSLSLPGSDVIARGISAGVPLVWLRAATGTSGASTAAGAFAALGRECLAVDLRRHPAEAPVGDLLATAARDAGLHDRGLVVIGCEALAASPEMHVLDELEQAAVPVVAISTKPWNPHWLPRLPLVVEARPLAVEDRARTWAEHLGGEVGDDPELREALLGLRLSAEEIVEAARYADVLAQSRDEPLGAEVVREAARRVGGSGGALAERMTGRTSGGRLSFDDLVLPDHVADPLRRLVSWARHRDSLDVAPALRGRGRGIAALFAGNPGTGKTLAAHVIAEELAIDLFQVELSSIVDKYIGETEKNLERVFNAAEALDVVLFFDEADALFGARSGGGDARERYANQEVAYLLQRMEHFDGITILSTNLRGNLDKAFSRRMSFIVNFPDPDAPTRRRLWQHHVDQLGDRDPADPIDVARLADAVELAGGDVRNIVLASAYDAVAAGEQVGHRHVVAATRREFTKLGRVAPGL